MKSDCFVSVVAPFQDASAVIETFIGKTIPILEENFKNYELLLIDDGSQDDSLRKVQALLAQLKGIRVIQLSRRFGTDVAISVGLESVIGDYVVVMLPSMDPPDLIPQIVERSLSGIDVVFGVRAGPIREGWLYQAGSRLFHWYCERFLQLKLPRHSTQLRCLSRKALNAITQIKDFHRYLRLYSSYVGYPQQEFLYSPIDQDVQKPGRRFLGAVSTCIDLIIENSRHPLRIVTWTCVFAAMLNLSYIVLIVVIYFFKPDVTPGWTSISFQSAFQFLLITLMFTILSEYIGRILERLRERPFYFVMNEQMSSVLLVEKDRYNIVTESPKEPIFSGVNVRTLDPVDDKGSHDRP
jgi:glycosyltransferase involved in cell wall biosynthesis